MKDKILLFVIGVLVGALISTGAFFVYTKTANLNSINNGAMQMPGGTPPSMSEGQSGGNGQPPEIPAENNAQNSDNAQNESSNEN